MDIDIAKLSNSMINAVLTLHAHPLVTSSPQKRPSTKLKTEALSISSGF